MPPHLTNFKSTISTDMKDFKEIKILKDEYIKADLCKCVASDETVEDAESFFLTPLNQEETGLPMCVHLRCIENKGEAPFLRFQNDRDTRYNSNWVKMYLDGTLDNYENKKILFTEKEMQALKNWINLNKDIITKHYYQEYDSFDVYKMLRKFYSG